jgi:hypothetical protein
MTDDSKDQVWVSLIPACQQERKFINNISSPHELINQIVENQCSRSDKKVRRRPGLFSLPCVYGHGVKT